MVNVDSNPLPARTHGLGDTVASFQTLPFGLTLLWGLSRLVLTP
jgi:hypothetical protein